MTRALSGFLLLAFLGQSLAGCSSATVIRSTDPDAAISVDGEHKGYGAVAYADKKVFWSKTPVQISKPGCPVQNYEFTRAEEWAPGPFFLGLVTLVPLLWMMKYQPEHYFEYSCAKKVE